MATSKFGTFEDLVEKLRSVEVIDRLQVKALVRQAVEKRKATIGQV